MPPVCLYLFVAIVSDKYFADLNTENSRHASQSFSRFKNQNAPMVESDHSDQ